MRLEELLVISLASREWNCSQLACPLGNDLKPSCKISMFWLVQISELTMTHNGLKPRAVAPTLASGIRLRSGSQRERRSGRGLPKRSFMP